METSRFRTIEQAQHMAMYVVSLFLLLNYQLLHIVDETSSPDNSWYGTPSATLPQSKRKQDEGPPHEETRPRQDKEDKKRRRFEAKRQKPKLMVVEEKVGIPEPMPPLAAVSVQNDIPQVLEDLPPSTTDISNASPNGEPDLQKAGMEVDLQAGFRTEGVSLTSSFKEKSI
jgi:hypothetical protein